MQNQPTKPIRLNVFQIKNFTIFLGFMLCAMFLSMWISNTAATAMMVPIVDAIHKAINTTKEDELEDGKVNILLF